MQLLITLFNLILEQSSKKILIANYLKSKT